MSFLLNILLLIPVSVSTYRWGGRGGEGGASFAYWTICWLFLCGTLHAGMCGGRGGVTGCGAPAFVVGRNLVLLYVSDT